MKKNLDYSTYLDKVYGCFLGKCIGGTAGGPAEGRKELLDFPLDEEILHKSLPNDDLDLQIMWLELIEDKGFNITSRDMAETFFKNVPYGPGEYAVLQKNYERGIYPPISGRFNNRYYKNGMGCPIRSEIWACLFPGDKESAKKYANMDGSLDHEKDSIDAEIFLTDLETSLFFSSDLLSEIKNALSSIPCGKLKNVLSDTLTWFQNGYDWKFTRGLILKNYGHADCTNLYQNMGFVLLALLYGKENFKETLRLGLACGYDTDCICASAASVLGIMSGANNLLEKNNLCDTGLAISVNTRRKSGSIKDFARDVCAVGIEASKIFLQTTITDYPTDTTLLHSPMAKPVFKGTQKHPFTICAEYFTAPVLGIEQKCDFALNITSSLKQDDNVTLTLNAPNGICVSPSSVKFHIADSETIKINFSAWAEKSCEILSQKNIFTVTCESTHEKFTDSFGIIGCEIWFAYGPFIANNRDISHIPPNEIYDKYLLPENHESHTDVVREYHLGGIADIDREFVDESEPFLNIEQDHRPECIPSTVQIGEDLFDIAKIQPYEGPHIGYLLRKLYSPEERKIELAVGHTAPFKLWVNGKLVGTDKQTKWWTVENRHFYLTLNKGENIIILKYAQISNHAEYSLIYRIDGGDWRQYADMGSYIR